MDTAQYVIQRFLTKSVTVKSDEERIFEAILTAEVVDKQNEIIVVEELEKVLPVWMSRGAPISDTHTSRICGKGLNYSRISLPVNFDGIQKEVPAIKVTGMIFRNYELDDMIWGKIKNGEYRGVSFGGATKTDREPVQLSNGSVAFNLKDLEQYEMAVCPEPANPVSLITNYNTLAKSFGEHTVDVAMQRVGLNAIVKCDKVKCYVTKAKVQVEDSDDIVMSPAFMQHLDKKIDQRLEELIEKKVAKPKDIIGKDELPEGLKHREDMDSYTKADFKCPHCKVIADNEADLAGHIERSHKEEKAVAMFKNQSDMKGDMADKEKVATEQQTEQSKEKTFDFAAYAQEQKQVTENISKDLKSLVGSIGELVTSIKQVAKPAEVVKDEVAKDEEKGNTLEATPNQPTKVPNAPYNNPDNEVQSDEKKDELALETKMTDVAKATPRTGNGEAGQRGASGNDGGASLVLDTARKFGLEETARQINSGQIPRQIVKSLSRGAF